MDDETVRRGAPARPGRSTICGASLETSRERVGVEPDELRSVVGAALTRAGALARCRCGRRGRATRHSSASIPAIPPLRPLAGRRRSTICASAGRGRSERLATGAPRRRSRAVAFTAGYHRRTVRRRRRGAGPPRTPAGAPAAVALPQPGLPVRPVARLRRLGPGAQPRVVLLGRLRALRPRRGAAARGDLPVTAAWTEAGRGAKPLTPFGDAARKRPSTSLKRALRRATPPARHADDAHPGMGGQGRCRPRTRAAAPRRASAARTSATATCSPTWRRRSRRSFAACSKTSARASPRPPTSQKTDQLTAVRRAGSRASAARSPPLAPQGSRTGQADRRRAGARPRRLSVSRRSAGDGRPASISGRRSN